MRMKGVPFETSAVNDVVSWLWVFLNCRNKKKAFSLEIYFVKYCEQVVSKEKARCLKLNGHSLVVLYIGLWAENKLRSSTYLCHTFNQLRRPA